MTTIQAIPNTLSEHEWAQLYIPTGFIQLPLAWGSAIASADLHWEIAAYFSYSRQHSRWHQTALDLENYLFAHLIQRPFPPATEQGFLTFHMPEPIACASIRLTWEAMQNTYTPAQLHHQALRLLNHFLHPQAVQSPNALVATTIGIKPLIALLKDQTLTFSRDDYPGLTTLKDYQETATLCQAQLRLSTERLPPHAPLFKLPALFSAGRSPQGYPADKGD